MSIAAFILAAGKGTRMRSDTPKVLHQLAKKPLLRWVIDAVSVCHIQDIFVVYGQGGEQVKTAIALEDLAWVYQQEQLGTGHAVQCAMQACTKVDIDQVLIVYGDTPLISAQTLTQFIKQTPVNAVGLLTAKFDEPYGLGRIIRDAANNVTAIVEEKDASKAQKTINEINTGIMLIPADHLKQWLTELDNNNAQNEYYITDVIAMAVQDNVEIAAYCVADNSEVQGINTRAQLAHSERILQMKNAEQLMDQGVSFADPARFDLCGELECGRDVCIDINVIIEGTVTLGNNVKIGANVILKNVSIGDDTEILPNTMMEESHVGKACTIGPFARLRPGTKIADHVKVGNFVETKKAIIDSGSKLSHLSYIGDAVIGKNVNIGAGTITCNYDGVNKFTTTIEDGVFVGSDTQLIAPVTIGKNAYIGAGSSINKDAPADKLTVARARQKTIEHWQPPKK